MNENNLNIDFSKVENIRFRCIDYCGQCCFYQAPVLTTAEIKRIIDLLETINSYNMETFVFDWITWQNLLPQLTDEMIELHKKSLKWFWSPFLLEEAEEGILVKSYTIHSMPSTGRCKLLNPLDFTCFVYPARPDICKLYPAASKIDEAGSGRISVAIEKCPGIGSGFPLNNEEIKQIILRGFQETKRDIEAYEHYIHENGIKIITKLKRRGNESKIKDAKNELIQFEKSWRETYFLEKEGKQANTLYEGKKFIEPFAELKLIPPHPLLTLWNEKIERIP